MNMTNGFSNNEYQTMSSFFNLIAKIDEETENFNQIPSSKQFEEDIRQPILEEIPQVACLFQQHGTCLKHVNPDISSVINLVMNQINEISTSDNQIEHDFDFLRQGIDNLFI